MAYHTKGEVWKKSGFSLYGMFTAHLSCYKKPTGTGKISLLEKCTRSAASIQHRHLNCKVDHHHCCESKVTIVLLKQLLSLGNTSLTKAIKLNYELF